MFEALRKKLTDTIKGFSKREETKSKEQETNTPVVVEPQETKPKPEIEKQVMIEKQEVKPKVEIERAVVAERHETISKENEEPVKIERYEVKPKIEIEKPVTVEKYEAAPKVETAKKAVTERLEVKHATEAEMPVVAERQEAEHTTPEKHFVAENQEVKITKAVEKPVTAEKHEEKLKIDLKLVTKIKKIFVNKITLSSTEIDGFAESLKEPMLRSDVSYNTADEFVRDLKRLLAETQINSGKIDEEVTNVVRSALLQTLNGSSPKMGFDEMIEHHIEKGGAPVKILFLGPNGAGKTTTIAKLAYNLKTQGRSLVLAASDTFRAAAIEQLEIHARKIGVPIIKSKYGADPASVAFDAIAHARSNGIQLVLIDSAGRQETNKSLISEIEKIVRVCKPDITIFIGESTAGNVISEQIGEFGKHVHIDGIILTKLDCDAKGGSALSIAKVTGVPILFFGTGESYDALMPYSSEFIVNAILPTAS